LLSFFGIFGDPWYILPFWEEKSSNPAYVYVRYEKAKKSSLKMEAMTQNVRNEARNSAFPCLGTVKELEK
jgi:hypothetical protein